MESCAGSGILANQKYLFLTQTIVQLVYIFNFFYQCIIQLLILIIQKILASSVLIEKGLEYDNLTDYIGAGLVTSRGILQKVCFKFLNDLCIINLQIGNRWRRDRKQLNPAFNRQLFDGFIKVFNKESKILVQKIQLKFANDDTPKSVYPYFISAAMEMIISECITLKL